MRFQPRSVPLVLTNCSFFETCACCAQRAGKYTVKADYEKAGTQELTVKSGETLELIKQEDDGQWWENGLRETYRELKQIFWQWSCIDMYGPAGLCATWALPRRARSQLLISCLSLENPSPASRSPAQVGNSLSVRSTTTTVEVRFYTWCRRSLSFLHVSLRGQRLWEPQHLIQLQRDLHKLLWHQTLNSSAPQAAANSWRGSLRWAASVTSC